jgi:hypothetical protein
MEAPSNSQKPIGWRALFPPHPACAVFDPLPESEFKELADSIKAHGQKVPVVLWTDPAGKTWLLDGKTRLDARESVGLPVLTELGVLHPDVPQTMEPSASNPVDAVIAYNMQRRQMSRETLAFVGAKLANLRHGVRFDRSDQQFSIENSRPEPPITIAEAAVKLGVPERAINDAKAIRAAGASDLEEAVKAGQKSLSGAAKEARNRTAARKGRPVPAPRPQPPASAKAAAEAKRKEYQAHRDGLKMRGLTREEVDPEFTGTPLEFTGKYGHCPQRTARELARDGAKEWSFVARKMVSDFQKQPELKPVDINWLRDPMAAQDKKRLADALAVLGPVVDHLREIIAKG